MRNIFKYQDFMLEKKLELLLEAKMSYSEKFSDVLKSMDSPIAKAILGLAGQEVDVNTNYIDISLSKEDSVFFKPEDKAAKAVKVINAGDCHSRLADALLDNPKIPSAGQIGEITKTFTYEEAKAAAGDNRLLLSILRSLYEDGNRLVVFAWRDAEGKKEMIYDTRSLATGPDAVKASEVGVGKFATAVLKKAGIDFTVDEMETFVHMYKAKISAANDVFGMFGIVKGEDIKYLYLYSSYESQAGTLGQSCMRYDDCQDYFDIYVMNPEVCSMVVKYADEGRSKISGRAILWTDKDGRKIMDRIYVNKKADEEIFKEYAKKSGFYHKENQNMSESEPMVSPSGEAASLKAVIYLRADIRDYDHFPYMDTFKYYTIGNGKDRPSTLTNDYNSSHDYCLTSTEGTNGESCQMCEGEGRLDCPECSGDGSETCHDCSGSGEVDCSECDGNGEVDCKACGGSGEDGEDEDGGTCSACDGSGKEGCSECNEKGTEECVGCGGNGTIECDFCYGEGRVDCPEC